MPTITYLLKSYFIEIYSISFYSIILNDCSMSTHIDFFFMYLYIQTVYNESFMLVLLYLNSFYFILLYHTDWMLYVLHICITLVGD